MEEIIVKIPDTLKEEKKKIERDVAELISEEEKKKLILILLNNLMKNSNQLNESELVEMGRKLKKGRFEKLKEMGLIK